MHRDDPTAGLADPTSDVDAEFVLAVSNGPLLKREGIALRPVTGVGPSELVPAWRRDDARPVPEHLRAAV